MKAETEGVMARHKVEWTPPWTWCCSPPVQHGARPARTPSDRRHQVNLVGLDVHARAGRAERLVAEHRHVAMQRLSVPHWDEDGVVLRAARAHLVGERDRRFQIRVFRARDRRIVHLPAPLLFKLLLGKERLRVHLGAHLARDKVRTHRDGRADERHAAEHVGRDAVLVQVVVAVVQPLARALAARHVREPVVAHLCAHLDRLHRDHRAGRAAEVEYLARAHVRRDRVGDAPVDLT
mmetsp:Transcript_14492/g.45294  ORF Transcript_14492/g.45294 Transcript_14492/m.45294 type:complete len:236 (-) Transcript_14492:838-1545(-)